MVLVVRVVATAGAVLADTPAWGWCGALLLQRVQERAAAGEGKAGGMTTFTIEGLRLPSLANLRLHWAKLAKLKATQKLVARSSTLAHADVWRCRLPMVITLTRIGPRKLDVDNLAASLKGTIDGIALALDVDDGDDGLEWRFKQERAAKGAKHAYGVRVEIAAKGEEAA